jgi:HD-like signal output (HDOD) protein
MTQGHNSEIPLINPPQKLQDFILGDAAAQLVLPSIVSEIMQVISQENFSMKELEKFILQDATLALEILRLANSPLFMTGQPVTSLLQAIVRLGAVQCCNLIHSVCITQVLNSVSLEQEWLREVLFKHGLSTAMIAVRINRALGLGFKGEEFTAGLLHDFGRTLFAVSDETLFTSVDTLEFDEEIDVLEKEQAAFGIDHCSLGAWYADQCGLPAALISATQYHHSPKIKHPHQKLTALICAADEFANHVQRHDVPREYDTSKNEGIAVLAELLGIGVLEQFAELAPELIMDVQTVELPCKLASTGSFND